MEDPPHLTSILGALLGEGVEFVLVGALAAVAQGAPLRTHDVDVVHARTRENRAGRAPSFDGSRVPPDPG